MVLSKTLILILFINLVKSNSVPGPCPEEEQFFLNRRKFVIKIKTPLCQSNDVLEKSGSQTTKKAIACDVDDCYDKNNNSRTVKIVISADAPTKCEEEAPQDQGNDAQENSVLQPIKKTKACNVNARYDKNHDTPGLKKDFLPADAREGQNKTKEIVRKSRPNEEDVTKRGFMQKDEEFDSNDLPENKLWQVLKRIKENKVASIFRYSNSYIENAHSNIYQWKDLLNAILIMFKMSKHKLWDGDDNIEYGLVHIAAFLAQAMEEGIKANTCEELNAGHPHEVQKNKTVYSASAACGQGNELYENRGCSEEDEEAYMACNVNPDMILRAKVLSNWDDAPPGFFCAPRKYLPLAPRWVVHGLTCNSSLTPIDNITEYISYVKKEGRCRDYKQINSAGWSYADCDERRCTGPTGRVHVQGCCWWGRGVLLTSGVCTLGKLNTYLREIPELTPPENLCLNPSAVCDNRYPYLKWILGLFDYVTNVQDYAGGDWEYKTALKNWVDNGKSRTDPKFIDIVSKVFKSGSPAGIANEASQRENNFFEVLKIFGQYKEGE